MSRLTVYGGGLPSGGAPGLMLSADATGKAAWVAAYTPPLPSVGASFSTSTNLAPVTTAGATLALGVNGTVLVPVFLPVAMTIAELGVYVTVATAGATIELGFFTWTVGATTESLLFDAGAASGATTGYQGIANPSPLVGPGLVSVAIKASAAVTVSAFNLAYGGIAKTQPGSTPYAIRSVTGAAGAFPATYSGLTNGNFNTPWVSLTRGS